MRALKNEGFDESLLDFLKAVTTMKELADPAHPCKGAVPRKHSHYFSEAGTFGSHDWLGRGFEFGFYEIVDDRTFVTSDTLHGDTSFHYRIVDDLITFDPVIPRDCSTKRCREAVAWSVSFALPGTRWQRAR